ncbi:MAG: winged helix DNA-binding domain-containing protein [Actinomycetota bacterium]
MTPRTIASADKAPVRTLSERELNRALLARQLLLERADIPLTRAIEQVGGLQTQYAPSGYLGLWTRTAGFERAGLTRALEQRRVIQGTLMRATIHMVSKRDYPLFAAGIRNDRLAHWRKVARDHPQAGSLPAVVRKVRRYLEDGPKKRTAIQRRFELDGPMFDGVSRALDMVRVPPPGTWEQRRADLYGLAEQWIGPLTADPAAGVEHLVRRYLAGFGPASKKDILGWAGLDLRTLSPVLDRMKLRRFRDERGGELLDLPRAPLPDADTPAPVRFLPTFDATLLVNCRRTQILPERYRPVIFNVRTPQSVGTFLVDGQVAGTWSLRDGSPKVEPLSKLPPAARRELTEETERLREFVR